MALLAGLVSVTPAAAVTVAVFVSVPVAAGLMVGRDGVGDLAADRHVHVRVVDVSGAAGGEARGTAFPTAV